MGDASEVERLRAENERLRQAFASAIEDMVDMRSYVPGWAAEKWNHDEAIALARAALAVVEGEAPAPSAEAPVAEPSAPVENVETPAPEEPR